MMEAERIGRGTAAGKIILLGEHAVVHGTNAIAAGIDRGASATAHEAASPSTLTVRIDGEDGTYPPLSASTAGEEPIDRALRALLAKVQPGGTALAIEATSRVAPGGGLGCSAALAVAIARAALAIEAPAATLDDVASAARAWEEVFHGNPSGIDTTAAAHGGCFVYSRQTGAKPLALPNDLWLAVGWSGKSSSTREMVESVARRRTKDERAFDEVLRAIETLVSNAELAIEAGDVQGLGRLMDLNQMLLAGWMLSTEEIETLCRRARERGALGAKLTGGGGGGSVIALVPSAEGGAAVLEGWRGDGLQGFLTRVEAAR